MILNTFDLEDLYHRVNEHEHKKAHNPRHLTLLAEGDSYFSIGGFTSNLLMAIDKELTAKGWEVLIVNTSHPGAITHTLNDFNGLVRIAKWDACLLSVGGNDLIDLIQNCLPSGNIDKVWPKIQEKLLALRDMLPAKVPVIANGYNAIGTQRVAHFLQAGPWAGSRLADCGVPKTEHDRIVNEALRQFNIKLKALEVEGIYVANDTLYTLALPTWPDSVWKWAKTTVWRNEIHPSFEGYKILASMHWVPTIMRLCMK